MLGGGVRASEVNSWSFTRRSLNGVLHCGGVAGIWWLVVAFRCLFGCFWWCLVACGGLLWILVVVGSSWWLLVAFGSFWLLLEVWCPLWCSRSSAYSTGTPCMHNRCSPVDKASAYNPCISRFNGSILARVLANLRQQSLCRPWGIHRASQFGTFAAVGV